MSVGDLAGTLPVVSLTAAVAPWLLRCCIFLNRTAAQAPSSSRITKAEIVLISTTPQTGSSEALLSSSSSRVDSECGGCRGGCDGSGGAGRGGGVEGGRMGSGNGGEGGGSDGKSSKIARSTPTCTSEAPSACKCTRWATTSEACLFRYNDTVETDSKICRHCRVESKR